MRIAGSIDTEVISRGQGSISDKQTSNSWEPVSHNEKKRKRDAPHGAQRAELGHFVIQTQFSVLSGDEPTLFASQFILPRSHLPLAYIDSSDGSAKQSGSSLFAAAIKELEVLDDESLLEPAILITQSPLSDRFYAIEKVQPGLYALCRLAPWLTFATLERLVLVAHRQYNQHERPIPRSEMLSPKDWWKLALVQEAQKSQESYHGPNRSFMQEWPQLSFSKDTKKYVADSLSSQGNEEGATGHQIGRETQPSNERMQDPEEVLSLIRTQYQEFLYVSKAPLSYFAKGPISKARAYSQLHDGSSRDCSRLTAHLKSLLMSLPVMDKKYRDTIPNIVKELPFKLLSEDDGASLLASRTKSRKSKGNKLSNSGLYPGEEANVARWWIYKDASNITCDTFEAREECSKRMIFEQRSRETELQIILVLETLALEASFSAAPILEVLDCHESDSQRVIKKSRKPKKPQNLDNLLDLMIDRLSIWQSTEIEEAKSGQDQEPKLQNKSQQQLKVNRLHQFCVDVVIPFYGSRLPEKTAAIYQKLGGPKDPSPKRPVLVKSASANNTSTIPGAAVLRQASKKPRRTLERVLTDAKPANRKQMPSLSRSATEPMLPQVKREVTDTSLSSIPLNRVSMSRRYTHREVDLRAASQATEDKIKKKASIDKELQSAIAALKKPNPRMAVQELVDAAEQRATNSRLRKAKNPVRNQLARDTQVMATPSKDRKRNSSSGILPRPQATKAATVINDEVPPSSTSKVPCSTVKPDPFSAPEQETSVYEMRKAVYDVEQTPTRNSSKFFGRPSSSSVVPKSTAMRKQPPPTMLAEEAEPIAESGHLQLPMYPSTLLATPLKSRQSLGDTNITRYTDLSIQATPSKGQNLQVSSDQDAKMALKPLDKGRKHDDDDDVELL